MTSTVTTAIKYINIDSRLQNESYVFSEYYIRLHEKIRNVKSLSIASVEMPISFYNISCYRNNNFFRITKQNKGFGEPSKETMIVLPDDNYTIQSIFVTLQTILQNNVLTKDLEIKLTPTNTIQFYSKTSEYTIDFLVNTIGIAEDFCLKSKLGWILGFRLPSYAIRINSWITAETTCDLSYPRYVYLSLEFHDEDNKCIRTSFDSTLFHSCINKNIIARITLENRGFPYGSILPANIFNGLLISDNRKFHSSIDIKKIKVKIVDEFGIVMNLNGFDMSFLISYESG
jgi:hypothetical protein